MFKNIACVIALSFVVSINAQCVYNDTMCTCLFGSTEGSCYTKTGEDSTGDLCSKRTCNAGWTCDCDGDYYCSQSNLAIYTLKDFDDAGKTTNVECREVLQRTITSSGFQLGYFHPQFSDKGLLDGQCQVFSWYLNGENMNNFGESDVVAVDASNLEAIKAMLSDWNNLPLVQGSVIGFRWKNAPYSCYNSFSELSVNGTVLNTLSSGVSHRFSNVFETNWFSNDFVEGSNWRESIASNTEDNYGEENTANTNTYWRIKIL